jgi:hypothetical protein
LILRKPVLRLLLCLLSIISTSILVPGQQVEATAARLTERMKSNLGLSVDQVPKVQAVNLSLTGALQKLLAVPRNGAPGEDQVFSRNALIAINNRETQIKQILTQPQWEKHNSDSVARLAEIETAIMSIQLKLTDKQLPQVDRANFEACRKIQAVVSNTGKIESATRRERFKADKGFESINAEHDRTLEKILSPDQWKIYLERRGAIRELVKKQVDERRSS